MDGTVGGDVGVTALVASDGTLAPTELDAVTVNTYDKPSVRPATVIGDVDPVAVTLPGLLVTV